MTERPPYHRSKHPIGVGNLAFIFKTPHSGKFWQFRYWVNTEKKYVRVSLRTDDFAEAKHKAEQKYLELIGKLHSGEKIFSITAEEQVRRFLAHQEARVNMGDVSHRQLSPAQYQKYQKVMRHYLRFVSPQTGVHSLKSSRFLDYVTFRRAAEPPPSFLTIKQEQTLIATLFAWSRDEQLVPSTMTPRFADFTVAPTDGRRLPFNETTYNQIITISKNWHKHAATESDAYDRRILHHSILAMSWYGWRPGEMLQIQWRDVRLRDDGTALVVLRPEVTKTKKARTNIGRGDIFQRLQSFARQTHPTDFVFSFFAPRPSPIQRKNYFYELWGTLKALVHAKYPSCPIETVDPYHFRHFYITVHLLAGDSPYDIARLCGNSVAMIEKHYDQVRDEQIAKKLLSKKVTFNADGTVTVTELKQEGVQP